MNRGRDGSARCYHNLGKLRKGCARGKVWSRTFFSSPILLIRCRSLALVRVDPAASASWMSLCYAKLAVTIALRSLLTFMFCAFVAVAGTRAQNLVPQPDSYAPYEEGTQGRYVPEPVADPAELTTANTVLWQQYQSLQSGVAPTSAQACQACGGNACGGRGCGPADRCSCTAKNFEWWEGPGHCDNWCLGPHWGIEASGLIFQRDDVDLPAIVAAVGDPTSVEDQFDNGPGARLFATAYNCKGWGMQVGYEGINEWEAALVFPDSPAIGSDRSIDYVSRFNSLEINFLPHTPQPWKVFSGVRYVQFDEKIRDLTTVDRVVPLPADPPAPPAAFVDTSTTHVLKNHLIGFQLGGLRDGWQVGEWLSFSGFANAGVYHNDHDRRDVDSTITTVITSDDISTVADEYSETVSIASTRDRRTFSEIAFLAEAGANVSLKLTPCLALKSGYQVIMLDGVGEGFDAFFNPDFDPSTVLFHGLQFGLEYRR